jgi:hypothetical protein
MKPSIEIAWCLALCATFSGCDEPTPPEATVDCEVGERACVADWALLGTREQAEVVFTLDATTAAETGLTEVRLRARLSEVRDIDQEAEPAYWTVAAVEGDLFDLQLVIDGLTYESDPAPRSGPLLLGPAPLRDTSTGAVVGVCEGDLNLYVLDPSGYDFSTAVRWAFDPAADPETLDDWPFTARFDPIVGSFAP